MTQTGLGVLINDVFGGREPAELSGLVGKKIKQVALVKGGYKDDALRIGFDSGEILTIRDDGQSCCESRYLTAEDDDLSTWQGAEFFGVELRNGPDVDDDGSVHEQVFLILSTSKGEQVFAAHNEHNGYYGGFSMVAEIAGAE